MLLELVESGLYSDTSLLCSDGEVTAPRAVVALTFLSLYLVLREQQEAESFCLVLSQFLQSEVEGLVFNRLTCSLQVRLGFR